MTPHLVELDSRRRAALGKIGHERHTRYLVSEEADGTLIFRPAVVMTEHEAALYQHPEVVEQLNEAVNDPSILVESTARRPRRGQD